MKNTLTIEYINAGELAEALNFCKQYVTRRAGSDAAERMSVVVTESSKERKVVRVFEEDGSYSVGVTG